MSNSPPLVPKNWPTVILFFIAIGIFSVAGFTFAQKITQNPWQDLGIALLLNIVFLFVTRVTGIATKVWQQLEDTWVKRIADWLDVRVLGILSGYRRRYLRYLFHQYRNFDTKGLSTLGEYTFDLEEIFVELGIAPIPPHQASADPLKVPDVLRMGQHSVWDYLAADPFSSKHLVIIGAPGSGKTTLLQHIVLMLVHRKKYKRTVKLPYKLPFLLFLRNYGGDLIENSSFSLVEAIHKQIDKAGLPSPPSGWVERQLTKGRCLILLDGLDELAEAETRREMSEWIQRQMIAYGNSRFIVTARPYGYRSNPLQGVWVLEVKGFSQNQIEHFVNNWYLADEKKRTQRNDPGVSFNARAEAQDLLQRIRRANALLKLAVNPLLLTMIATVHRYRGALPDNRVTLYEEMCEVLLGKRQEARGVKSELSPVQKQSVLRPLAYYMMIKGKREIALAEAYSAIKDPLALVNPQWTPEKFLKMVEESSGLWVEREPEVYGFTHMTFQEYLTAMHIKEEKCVPVLEERVGDGRWHETIRLYCARADATSIIAACLKERQTSVNALQLALNLREEASQMQPMIRAQFDIMLYQVVEEADPEKWKPIVEAMLAQRMSQMIKLNDETYLDTSLISLAEYRLFLDDQQAQDQDYRPDHWPVDQFPPNQGQAPILGVRPSDAAAFCIWLTERDTSGNWYYRLPKSGELEKEKKDESGDGSLVAGRGYWVDEGKKFVWIKENPNLSDVEMQERLEHIHCQHYDRIVSDRLDLNRMNHRELANNINKARALAQARILHRDIIRDITSLRNRIRERERTLQTDFDLAHKRTAQQQAKLKNVREREHELQIQRDTSKIHEGSLHAQVERAQKELVLLPTQIQGVDGKEDDLQTKIKLASRDERNLSRQLNFATNKIKLKSQLDLVRSNVGKWQEQLEDARRSKHNLQTKLDSLPGRIQNLQHLLDSAHTSSVELQAQLTNFHNQNSITNLQEQLEEFSGNEHQMQTTLDRFQTHAHPFYEICDRFLPSTQTFNNIHLISSSFFRNQALQLDRILDNVNNDALKEALDYVNDRISILAKDLVEVLTNYQNVHGSVANYGTSTSDDITRVLAYARELDSIPFRTNCQALVDLLKKYLVDLFPKNYTANNRRALRRRSLHRLCICYLTQEIIDHFCYWSWKELFSSTKQPSLLFGKRVQGRVTDQDIIEAYLDVYAAFTILEERIKGQLSPCEGILIVKELRTVNHIGGVLATSPENAPQL